MTYWACFVMVYLPTMRGGVVDGQWLEEKAWSEPPHVAPNPRLLAVCRARGGREEGCQDTLLSPSSVINIPIKCKVCCMSNTGRLFAQNPFRTPVAQPNLPRLGAVDWGLDVAHAGADLEDEGAGDLQELGDFGDSLLRRLCLDAVAVGDHATFGEVPTDRVYPLDSC